MLVAKCEHVTDGLPALVRFLAPDRFGPSGLFDQAFDVHLDRKALGLGPVFWFSVKRRRGVLR